MTVPVIHPRFMATVGGGFFPSLATVEAMTSTEDEYGQPIEGWVPVTGLQAIACAKAPLSAQERQAMNYTATDQAWNVLLQGAYPSITTGHRVVIDGVTHDIDAAETDQTGSITRLRVRSVGV
jgi:head-tail adaptor